MPKVIDHDQRRREIVEVAKRLMLRGGFEAATMRSIAAEAGFANGALKRYFSGKAAIIAATFEAVLADMRMQNLGAPGADPLVELRQFVECSFPLDEYRVNAGRVLLAVWDHAMSDEELGTVYRKQLDEWHQTLARLICAARLTTGATLGASDDELATEVMSVALGGGVISLMYPTGSRIRIYSEYIDRFMGSFNPGKNDVAKPERPGTLIDHREKV